MRQYAVHVLAVCLSVAAATIDDDGSDPVLPFRSRNADSEKRRASVALVKGGPCTDDIGRGLGKI